MNTWYRTGKLAEALVNAGIVSSKLKAHQWVTKAEASKKIHPFKSPSATGRPMRKFRQRDIDEIIKAFSVNGSGYWEPSPIVD